MVQQKRQLTGLAARRAHSFHYGALLAELRQARGVPGRRTGSAKVRALIEQAIATLTSWRILRGLRCSTTRITSLIQAVLTFHLASSS